MPADVVTAGRPPLRVHLARPPRWPVRRLIAAVLITAFFLSALATVSTISRLQVPDPTGPHGVGKHVSMVVDPTRPEPGSDDADDVRQVRLVTWYPAVPGSGLPAAYMEGLEAIRDGLVASGSVPAAAAAALGAVRDPSRLDATLDPSQATWPVVVLSPGNATNVESYGALAIDLTSRGFVVIGIDHPYQSAAVALPSGVAIYDGDAPMADAERITRGRIDERVADILAILDRIADGSLDVGSASSGLDRTRIGLMGHSNGGVAAAEACVDARVVACLNVDGQLAGGPFSVRPDPVAPSKPFLFLTKEIELHPRLAALFEAGGEGTFRVVVPAATHDGFTDGPLFQPRLLPLTSSVDEVMTVSRETIGAFFGHTLADAPRSVFGELDAPTPVQVAVYPLIRP
jgi:Platelet-activating factor acetylhydrolase, isoform II